MAQHRLLFRQESAGEPAERARRRLHVGARLETISPGQCRHHRNAATVRTAKTAGNERLRRARASSTAGSAKLVAPASRAWRTTAGRPHLVPEIVLHGLPMDISRERPSTESWRRHRSAHDHPGAASCRTMLRRAPASSPSANPRTPLETAVCEDQLRNQDQELSSSKLEAPATFQNGWRFAGALPLVHCWMAAILDLNDPYRRGSTVSERRTTAAQRSACCRSVDDCSTTVVRALSAPTSPESLAEDSGKQRRRTRWGVDTS